MNIFVISPKASEDSAKRLAKELDAVYSNPYKSGSVDFTRADVVINYGFSQDIITNRNCIVFNRPASVRTCINKLSTLINLRAGLVPVPNYGQGIAKEWDVVHCHTQKEGRKNEGIVHWYRVDNKPIPNAYLYTEHYEHRGEYRVVVLNGKVVGRYRKVMDDEGMWSLEVRDKRGFELMDAACKHGAHRLGMGYVGFDVLAKNKNQFVIIEANSGPILTDESIEAFKEFIGEL